MVVMLKGICNFCCFNIVFIWFFGRVGYDEWSVSFIDKDRINFINYVKVEIM